MTRYKDISAFVLCGGASLRMGRDKGLLEIGGQPLVVRTACLVEPLVSSVTIVGPPERYDALGFGVVADRIFGGEGESGGLPGPLVGIATALTVSGTAWNLILACDLPYLTPEWVDWLLAHAANTRQRIIMPRTERGLEPLAALYLRDCAAPIAASLARGVRKVTDAIEQFQVKFVLDRDWQAIDPDGRVLRNMNTLADYDEALAFHGKHEKQ